ncbi:unnamed protein product, partial [Closterium sp. Yama58-4]
MAGRGRPMAVVGGRGTPPAPAPHLIRPPLPPGPALIPGGPPGQVIIRHPAPPPPTMLLPVGAGSIEAKLAAQHGEIQQLLTENQRLAATHVALRQELAAAQGEIQRTKATLAAVQMEKDQAVRGIMEHKAKLEADLRAVEPLRGELHRARMELQALQARGGEAEAGRAEMQRQMSAMGSDMQRMRSDLEGMRQELMQAREAVERERRAGMEAAEQRDKAERTLEATAREVDRLRVTPLAVYGLPEDYTERQLVELFRTYGTVVAVQVARDGNRGLGYGYVHLDSPTSADIATLSHPFPSMAEAVVIARMRKKEAEEQASLTRSRSLLEDKFGAYERANRQMWARSSSFADSSGASPDANDAKVLSRSPLGQSPLYPHAVSNSSHVHGREETDAEEEANRRGFGSYTENHLAEQREADASRQTGGLQRKGDGNNQIENSSGGEGRVRDGGGIGEECLRKGWLWGESRETNRNEGDGSEGGEDIDGKERGCEDKAYGAGRGGEEVEPGARLLPQMDSIREDGDDEDVILANELEEIDKEVVQEVFNRVSLLRAQVQHYRALGGFVLLMALFVAMVYLQADSSRTYQVTAAHSVLIPSNFAPDSSNRFAGKADFYAWLNNSIIEKFWQDPPCGDGLCDQPLEFPAFGWFGCQADCGTFPNLTSVSIHFTTSFSSAEALALSSWNLCMQSPISLCWHALPQPFPALHAQFSLALDIPDGHWALLITAPLGGVQGVLQAQKPGMGHLSGDVTMGSSNSVTLASWGGCMGGEGFSARDSNATLLQDGGDQCRQACESVAMCLNTACGREVAAREVAGAFVDCVKICRAAPATIMPYATMSCLQITAVKPSLFPNSLCTGMAAAPAVYAAQAAAVSAAQAAAVGANAVGARQGWSSISRSNGAVASTNVSGNGTSAAIADSSFFPPPVLPPAADMQLPHLAEAPRAWELLGSTERQRLRALQVAVPVLDQPLCRFANSTGHQLLRAQELFDHLRDVHRGVNDKAVSSQQLRRFIDILIAALQSVTTMPPQASADLSAFFHRFEDAIVSTDIAGCSQGGTWLQWRAGVKHNTTIHVGDKITWVWDADLPHSLRIAGMGDAPTPFFPGFGGHRLAVSRLFPCSPMTMGEDDDYDDPVPCVLQLPGATNATFTYTKVFTLPGTYHYESGGQDAGEAASSASSAATAASTTGALLPPAMFGMVTVVVPPPEAPVFAKTALVPQVPRITLEYLKQHTMSIQEPAMLVHALYSPPRLLIGIFLYQERWGVKTCNPDKLLHLAGWCSNGTSREPFGVNPHFLPTSAIYDPEGWEGYPLVFDINLDHRGAENRLQYLVDGLFIDNATRKLEVSFITHNGESSMFVLTRVTAVVDTGGGFVTSFSSLSVPTDMYSQSLTSVFLLLLQAVYVAALLWNGVEEAVELRGRVRREGSVLSYLRSGWNWIDMASLLLQWLALITWVVLWRAVATNDMDPRYDVYESLLEVPRYWQVAGSGEGFKAAMHEYEDLQALINWRSFYFALQGVNLFLLMVRLLKLMDFQPYLGVITRSLALAMPSLLHFFLLTFIVFFCFALYGYLVFGGKMEQFATLPDALFTCFLIILNENATAYFFAHMHGWDLVAGMLFFIAFILLLVFILFNFLIAIIVDAFMTIKDSHVVATSITHDIGTILRYLINRALGRFSPYSDIMARLEQLGARNKQQDEAHKRMQRYQSFKRRAKSCLTGKVCGASAAEVERAKTMTAGGAGAVVAPQRVLQVKGQSIDDISLAMILQRRHAREVCCAFVLFGTPWFRFTYSMFFFFFVDSNANTATHSRPPIAPLPIHRTHTQDPSASLPSPSSASVLQISPESEQLSHVLLRQFGDHVVRDYSRPQHKPKHGLPQVQEELGKVKEAMDELKAMVLALHSAVAAGAGGAGVGFGGEGMLPAAATGVDGGAAGGAAGHYPLFSASSSAAAALARSSFSTTSSFSSAQGCFLSPNSLGTPLGTSPARDPFSPAASSLAAASPFIRNPFAAGNQLAASHPFAANNPFAGGNPFGTGGPQHRSLVLQRGAARRAGSAGRAGLRGSMGPSNLGRGNQASRQGNGPVLSRVETTPLPHRQRSDDAASARHGGSGIDSHADSSQQPTDESAAFVHADTMPMPQTRTSSFPYPEPEPRDAQAGSAQARGSSDGESADGDGKGSGSGEEQSEELSPLTRAARRVSLSEMEEGGGRMRKRGGESSNGRGASGAGGSGSVRKSVGFREVAAMLCYLDESTEPVRSPSADVAFRLPAAGYKMNSMCSDLWTREGGHPYICGPDIMEPFSIVSLLDDNFEAYEAANYCMWVRSKSDNPPSRKASGSRSRKQFNLDFLSSYGRFTPQNPELMARLTRSSSANPSVPVNEDQGGQGDGGDEVYGGICAEGGAERLAEEGRAGGEGSGTEGARDSSSDSSHESAADDEKGLRAFLRHCRQRVRRASNTTADESSAVGEEGEEGKATAARGPLKRSLTEDATGEMMARSSMGKGSLQGFTRGASLSRSASDVLQEAEMDEMDREVLQEAFARVMKLQQRVQHYRDLGGFVVLMALFITILYLQADSSRSYQITAAHAVLFPPGMSQDSSNTFNGPDDFYNWLNTSIVQSLWTDPKCGTGECERPFQFPAFGRFGCEADCGTFPNLTSIVVRFSSHLDTQQAADESSWNLCMVNPISLCWYESFQPFPRGDAEVSVAVDIPDGDWVVVLNAPAGGIRGTVHAPPPGTRRFSVVGAASTVELAAWGYCAHDDDVDAANQAQPSGGAGDSPRDVCRDVWFCLRNLPASVVERDQ